MLILALFIAVGPAKKEAEKPKESDPSFPIVLEDKTIKEGDDIVLKCKVIGEPRPKVGNI